MRPQWIDLEGGANVRDVGGLPTIDGHTTRSGVLLRSANLQRLSGADVRRLLDELHVQAVIDLRTDGERRKEGPGPLADLVTHHALTLVPSQADDVDVNEAVPVNPRRSSDDYTDMTGHYVGYIEDVPDNVAAVLRLIAQPMPGPALVHCAAGKDRTGTVVAIALSLVGVPREAVVADYVASAERIADVLASLQGSATYGKGLADVSLDMITPKAGSMERFLDHVDSAYGGPHGLAMAIGVDEETVARLAARLVARP